jgi:transcriptional regulator with XRE-family HTH domain
MSLGDYVRTRRVNLGLTQETVRSAIGVTERSYVSRLEHGDIKLPGPEIRAKLADVLQVRTIDLLAAAGEIRPDELRADCDLSDRVRTLAHALDGLSNDHLKMLAVIVQEMVRTQAAQASLLERSQALRRGPGSSRR